MTEWQPIDTAPKDGRHLLLWMVPALPDDHFRKPRVAFGSFSSERLRDWIHEYARLGIGVPPEWVAWTATNSKYQPTHWMPLPEPPETQP